MVWIFMRNFYRKELIWSILLRSLLAMGILRKRLHLVHFHVVVQAIDEIVLINGKYLSI